MSVLEKTQRLHQMMAEGKVMEAFEEFYHDNVVVVEADGEVRKGKAAQRQAIHDWMNGGQEQHGGGVGAITANEETGVTAVESWTDVSTAHGRVKMEEVAIQKWQDDKIIHERFYYNVPGQ